MLLWPLRLARRLATLVVLAAIVYLCVTGAQVWLASREQQDAPAQAIVVLGAAQYDGRPSPDLTARLQQALSLWRNHLAGAFLLTGGKQPADHYTESQSEAAWLEAHGVPPSDVLAEVGGRDSYQSLEQAAAVLHQHAIRKILLVSDPFHDRTIVSISSSLGLHGLASPTRSSPIRGASTVPYFAKETVAVAAAQIVGWHNLERLHLMVSAVST
ncbi:MAG: YdcF family protein [Acidimicrobiales bacterium]